MKSNYILCIDGEEAESKSTAGKLISEFFSKILEMQEENEEKN